jgi:histone acetyltransferase (RNA polymerase elongator complex component)
VDIEELNAKFDGIIQQTKFINIPSMDDVVKARPLIEEMIELSKEGRISQGKIFHLKRKYSVIHKNSHLFRIAQHLLDEKAISKEEFERLLQCFRIKRGKSHSGVLVITLFTSPYPEYIREDGTLIKQSFSCAWNCAYCPAEPGQPRSYLKGEPGVLRGNKNNFDCVAQMWDRMDALSSIGHPVDKLEVIVLGGTWASYPLMYRELFLRDAYYAANIYWDVGEPRERKTLEEEIRLNWDAKVRVIGLTLETRPDTVTPEMIRHFRRVGCTRVQLGIQHLDDDVLKKIRRQCPTERTVRAIQMLKDHGFKVDGHWMPNLPGSTVDLDRKMLVETLLGVKWGSNGPVRRWEQNGETWEAYNLVAPEFQVDQWKVYPCALVPWTDIEKWYREGSYVPYSPSILERLLIDMKQLVFPWIRLNRIIRDIPKDYILNEGEAGNLRQELGDIMKKDGTRCMCIRCREVKEQVWDGSYESIVRTYQASEGTEYFISAESKDQRQLYGFVRLRIPSGKPVAFKELEGCSFIRELHVYGQLETVGTGTHREHIQHRGLGRHLMGIAERIAQEQGYTKTAVIAGEGTRRYYEKLGYKNEGAYMIKLVISCKTYGAGRGG